MLHVADGVLIRGEACTQVVLYCTHIKAEDNCCIGMAEVPCVRQSVLSCNGTDVM